LINTQPAQGTAVRVALPVDPPESVSGQE